MWTRKSVLEGFGGKAEGFLEREECVDEEDGLRLGAERAEGKVVGFCGISPARSRPSR